MKKRIVLADPDPRSQKVLEVSLVQAGYAVATADDGEAAWARITEDVPDLVIADTRLPLCDGYGLVRKMRAKSEVAAVPVVFITHQRGVEDKIRGLELGVEEFLTKPVYAHELVSRVGAIFSRITSRALAAASPVGAESTSGKLGDIGLFDLMLTFESSRRTGSLKLSSPRGLAVIFFREGRIVDAEHGSLRGPDAIYRCFVWTEGTFQIELGAVAKEETITDSVDVIVSDATRRVKEWQRITEQLPPLTTVFDVDSSALLSRLPEIPDEINGILRLIDGRRTVWQLIDESPFDDLSTLTTLAKLYFEGLLKAKDDAREIHAPTARHGTLPPVVVTRIESVIPPAPAASAPSTQISTQLSPKGRVARTSDAPPSRTIMPYAVPPPQNPPQDGARAVAPPPVPPGMESAPPRSAPPLVNGAPFPVREETRDYAAVPKTGTQRPPEPDLSSTMVLGSSAVTSVEPGPDTPHVKLPADDAVDLENRTLRMRSPVSDGVPARNTSTKPSAGVSAPPAGNENGPLSAEVETPRAAEPIVGAGLADEAAAVAAVAAASVSPDTIVNAANPTPPAGVEVAKALSDDSWHASSASSSNPPRDDSAVVEPNATAAVSDNGESTTLDAPRSVPTHSAPHARHDGPSSLPPSSHMDEGTIGPPPGVRRVPGRYIAIPLLALMGLVAALALYSRNTVRGEHDTNDGLSISGTTSATTQPTSPNSAMGVAPTVTVTPTPTVAPTATTATDTTAAIATGAPTTSATTAVTAPSTGATVAANPTTAATVSTTADDKNPVAAAQQALEKGNSRRAVELAERATRNNPGDGEAWLTLGAAYQAIGAGARARTAFQKCADTGSARSAECKALLGNE